MSFSFWAKIPDRANTGGLIRRSCYLFGLSKTSILNWPNMSLRFDTWQYASSNNPVFAVRTKNSSGSTSGYWYGPTIPSDCFLNWKHYVLTCDFSTTTFAYELYIDGVLLADKTRSSSAVGLQSNINTNYLHIHTDDSIENDEWLYIDEIGWYNSILPQSAVTCLLYTSPSPRD